MSKISVDYTRCKGCFLCVSVCPKQALTPSTELGEKGYEIVHLDEEKCIACGQCAKVCPQNVIKIHECANYIVVKCSNKEKGAVARKQCEVSCIGCGICEKTCTAGAIHVEDNCAVIQEDICLSCGMCSVKCPRHVIHDLRGVFTAVR